MDLERVFTQETIALHRHIHMDKLIRVTVIANRQKNVKSVVSGQRMQQHLYIIN